MLLRFSNRATFAAILVGSIVGLGGPLCGEAEADLMYVEAPQFPSVVSPWTSTYDPTSYGSIYTTFDNFSLSATATVSRLTWQGFSFDESSLGRRSIPGLSFNVGFYASSAGIPGARHSSQTIGFTEPTAGTVDFYGNGQTETIYNDNYSGMLSGGFTAMAGTTYWLSAKAVTDFPACWTWISGTGGDGAWYQVENP